jgi:hypothetical protein
MKNWPPLSDFEATVGRLATAEDTRANRAAFLLTSDGVRIGTPISIRLPSYAWFADSTSGEKKRCILLQAEEADGRRYFGGWLIDAGKQIVGMESDFEVVSTEEPIQSPSQRGQPSVDDRSART